MAVRFACGAMRQPSPAFSPALMTVAKAVAVLPTWTDRLPGSTAATSAGGLNTRPLGIERPPEPAGTKMSMKAPVPPL